MPADTILDDGNSSMFHLDDKKASSEIEKNAEKIYDMFNSKHEKTSLTSGLVVPSVETAKKLDKMLNGNDKKTLYEALTALQEVMEEIEKLGNCSNFLLSEIDIVPSFLAIFTIIVITKTLTNIIVITAFFTLSLIFIVSFLKI